MIFTSISYFVFLLVALLLYYLSSPLYRKYILLSVSIYFYGSVRMGYLLLVLIVTLYNYFLAIKIENASLKKTKRIFLYISILGNVGILIYYKYLDFLLSNVSVLLGLFQYNISYPLLNLVLPLGLSYYVFQVIGYNIDIFRGTQIAEKNLLNFSLFILFFPKLLVGPIERAKNLIPQFSGNTFFYNENLIEGGKRIVWGLFKKLVVADRISIYTNAVFNNLDYHSGKTVLLATILYGFQVYADFSGYTDIAIGSARLFGIKLMENFNRPFFSRNISEYWRRWHISLSSWVNDYIYSPISLRYRNWGNYSIYYALLISFIVIGIWHGAKWNYLLFGLIQAMAMIFEVITKKSRKKISKKMPPFIYNSASIFLTFLFISFSLLVFRTNTFNDSIRVLNRIFTAPGEIFIDKPSTIIFIILGCCVLMLSEIKKEFNLQRFPTFNNRHWLVQQVSYALLIIYILLAGVFDGGQFIYAQF
jgi:alginate O-acetyltransferase complex protein AlgI